MLPEMVQSTENIAQMPTNNSVVNKKQLKSNARSGTLENSLR